MLTQKIAAYLGLFFLLWGGSEMDTNILKYEILK